MYMFTKRDAIRGTEGFCELIDFASDSKSAYS
jgi:hypothetical protein